MLDNAEGHLKRGCRLTGAAWAALVRSEGGIPRIYATHGIAKRKIQQLERLLSESRAKDWYQQLLLKAKAAPLSVPTRADIGVPRAWGFIADGDRAVLVGADALTSEAKATWALVASLMGGTRSERGASMQSTLEADAAYDSSRALDSILASVLDASGQDGAWLAIRRGEQLVIAASRHSGPSKGTVFDLQGSPLLSRMRRTRSTVSAKRGQALWETLPHRVGSNVRAWSVQPLVVGSRLIGAVATWGAHHVSPGRAHLLRAAARQAAQHVDLVVSLSEMTSQLRRLATLNEFALAISSAEELPQLARRVLDHLSTIFPERRVALYVPTLEGGLVREFAREGEEFRERTTALKGHALERLFPAGDKSEPEMANAEDREKAGDEAPMTLPLRYRESVVGALTLEGTDAVTLSRYDRSMLAVMASYMAGVVEHSRLRSEAMDRAHRLEQTVDQLRHAELAASTRLEAQQAAESRLLQAAKLAAVGEMAAGVAHELNNPLTTVVGFAELVLDETPADAPYRADLEMVLREAHRARSVVRRLLDFARQGEQARARADINEIVEEVLALMRHFIHTSGVQLEVEAQADLPWIMLDANQIKQVLLNLLHNALNAMPAGGHLLIATERAARDNRDGIAIRIADTGSGMEPEELARIFDPFYTTRAASGGTGLGLSVTYGIVSEHGGTIDVESERGRGSTFSVWLPL